ncbi:(RS)-norcoclaurine 6-O-methyltransferase [Amborella trichopoda]|uniref:O-methyltransferase domain-containing protein n=1 Tax=Amborella trichopoda TaxID=13333 RepID=U5DBV9_AMBTC|nr:(RS)-norcoclaurine 6-O-methyltransferase [Amborella trichopoda]ERN19695.1 hypothetical protein AMTR_s00062p00190100 [Amborella trichopoda]|eukprot:XP_006858228.1 (RS)-norcoclaurine 6-O-methyltransferase [Amborella trichopoda]
MAFKETQHQQQGKEEVEAQAVIWEHMFGMAKTMALNCAVRLGLADIIHAHGRPITLFHLASLLPIQPVNPDRLHRLMRFLVHTHLFAKTTGLNGDEETYWLTPSSQLLLRHAEKSMSGFARVHEMTVSPWLSLGPCLEEGVASAFEKTYGMSRWEYSASHPDENRAFNEAMACLARLVMPAIVGGCERLLQGARSVVDVGGGTGTAVGALAKAFPSVKFTLYDLPHVVATVGELNGVDTVGGDMFSAIPKADVVFLMRILHDWGDKECLEILKQIRKAIPEEGKVIIVDVVLKEEEEHVFRHARMGLDMVMMVQTGGKERDEGEWAKLLHDAGFKKYEVVPIMAVYSIIVAFP